MRNIKRASSKKKILTLSLLILLLCMSIGYAALSGRLKLNAIAKINASMWDVHFENIRTSEGSIVGNPVIGSDKTSISLEFTIGEPGDYYEFYVDVVNNGSMDARVESLVKTTLTEIQSHYLTFHVTYEDGVEIQKGDSLKVGEREHIKVLIQFNRSINVEELPSTDEAINLECQINYVQEEGTGSPRKRKVLSSVLSSVAESDANINFGAASSDTNGLGVYTLSQTKSSTYPVYYYRGNVTNNNVIFGNFCWKIIRTTNTGGVKLIYNGIPNNGVCNATGEATEIGKSVFNTENNDPKYVGYMYDNNTINSTIKNVVDEWFATNLIDYLDYIEDTPFYNERDYEVGETYSERESYPNIFATTLRENGTTIPETQGGVRKRLPINIGAKNKNDIFTISSEKGNGALTFPVGLITLEELVLAGGSSYFIATDNNETINFYLNTGTDWWSLSPCAFSSVPNSGVLVSRVYMLPESGIPNGGTWVNTSHGVRPVISLQPEILYIIGDGMPNSPYIIAI